MTKQSNLAGIGYMILGAGSFVLNDSLMKLLLGPLPALEVLVLRGIFGVVSLVPMLIYMGQVSALPAALNRWVMLRGLLEVGAIFSFIAALSHAPQADVTAIFQTTPMLIVLGMVFFHGETLDRLRTGLIVLGFGGALMVAQPGSEGTSPFAMLAFLTAAFAAMRDLVARNIPADTPVLVSTMVTVVLVLLASALFDLATEVWIAPTSGQIALMVAAGFLMSIGHAFTFLAYKYGQARVVAPFYYSFMVWALIFGHFMFDTVPNTLALAGMALILLSGVAVIYLEQRNRSALPESMATGHE